MARDGARAVLRRRPEVAWLKPDLSLQLRAGSGFTFAGGATDVVTDVGTDPVEILLDGTHAGP